MNAIASLLLRFRTASALVFLAAVTGAIALLPRVEFSFSIYPLLVSSVEQQVEVARLQDEFPPRGFHQICVVEWPREIGPAELDELALLVERLEETIEVESVMSLPGVPVVEPGAGLPTVKPFQDVVGEGTALEAAREHPLILRRLLSADGRSACVFITYDYEGPSTRTADERMAWAKELLPRHLSADAVVHFLGGLVAQQAVETHLKRDMLRTVLLELLVFAAILPFLFRSVRSVVLPLAVIVCSLVFNLALLVLVDERVQLLDQAIPGLILIIGLSDVIHMLHRFEEALAEGHDRRGAVVAMMDRVGPACFFTSVTTGIGFLSLLVADHAAVREFGVKAAIAVFVTFVTVTTLLPIGLSLWPAGRTKRPGMPGLRWLGYGRPRLTVLVTLAVTAISALGVARVVVDSRWLEELPEDGPVAEGVRFYEEQFSGALRLEATLEGDLRDAAVFVALEDLQREMLSRDGVNRAESYTHWIREVTGERGDVSPAQLIAGLGFLSLAGPFFPEHVVSEDFQKGRLLFQTGDIGSKRFFELREELNELARDLPAGVQAEVSGFSLMANESARLIVETLLQSLAVSVVAISLLIALIYRSARIGLISIVPNLLPVFVALGLNGWLGIPLRIGIVMLYSLGLGLAVDDSIHLLTRFDQERRAHPERPMRQWIQASLRSAGSAMVVTSIVLLLGTMCFLPSSMQSLKDVGLLLGAVVVSALIADLWLLPLLLERFGPRGPKRSSDPG